MGGIIGSLLTGLLASKAVNPAVVNEGWLVGGDSTLFMINAKATGAVILFAVVGTFIIIKLVGLVIKLRVSEENERAGLDETLHGETFRSK